MSFFIGSQAGAAEKSAEPSSDIVFRLGNESNQNDGLYGPLTFGFRANHTFNNQIALEAGYIRLHEPGTTGLNSVLDEAQATLKLPESHVLNQPISLATTAWKNRMIDMYIDVVGLQMTRNGELNFNFGIYNGSATLNAVNGRFIGFEAGISGSISPIEISLDQISGKIENEGYYRKDRFGIEY